MRIAFVQTLIQCAERNPDIMLLTGDLGFSVFEEYMERFPKQFINMGVSEQNMIGVAAGMALEGKIPIAYSIVPFAVMRPFEQIRNDVCYQNVNVKIVGVGAGFSYGPYGHTHHGLEDIGILRTLPNLTILAPGDPVETVCTTEAMFAHTGPVYLRLGRAGEPIVHKKPPQFHIGKGIVIKQGTDLSIITTSTMLHAGRTVHDMLAAQNVSAGLVSMPSIKPFDIALIFRLAKRTKYLVTIEEHHMSGGLGSVVADILVDFEQHVRLQRFGVPDRFTKTIGNQEHLRRANGLMPEQITKEILKTKRKYG